MRCPFALGRLLLDVACMMALLHPGTTNQCKEAAETLCHEGEGANPGWDQQLVVYSPPKFLQPLQQKERRVEFASREWIIQQDWDSIGVAAVVWEPALALCRYLEEDGAQLVRGKRVIELGAGTGLVGLVAHGLGARSVDVTDRNTGPAEHNLKLNSHNLDPLRPVAVRQLTWGQDVTTFQPPYDVLLAADVVYIEDSFPVLIQSMADLSDNRTTVLLSCKYRYKRDSRFLEMLRERFVGVTVWTSGDLSIYSFRKRA